MDPANASLLNPAGASRPYVAAPSSSSSSSSLPPANFPHDSHPRLSLVSPTRITAGSVVSALIGFSLGATQGGNTAQLRFRAEHAHKMPDSTAGWYLYHKTKNYHAMQGGIREGFKMAARTGFWSCMALSLESTVDRCRGATDMFSTIIASLTVAGAFSIWHRFSVSTAARTAKSGLLFGIVYGGIQDLLGLARGRPIGYVDFVRRRLGRGHTTSALDDRDAQ
ncbi:hypothetical protein V2G26_004772 [Clonostachys chloroleuca]|uniref:Uncharacterized protein n=1 Tax=Clonostachys chloroleuca TaxID=1926264 RepID=A0AA35Q8A6_9HYPO|nr:unnamed protein product [Clonostachys chloroleuca]